MKRSRFTEERIIGVLKEHQAGLSAVKDRFYVDLQARE